MSGEPEQVSRETRAGLPGVIYLPDRSQPKKPKRRRNHVEQFRTDEAEHAELERQAAGVGLSVNAFCRMKTLGEAGPRSRRTQPTVDSRLRAQHITAVNRVGNLINQGIHALNEIKLAAPAASERDRLADELAAVRKLLEAADPALSAALAAVIGGDRES